jgi:methylmalonyl-CoA/ethylmalonyl-CoA epimerase
MTLPDIDHIGIIVEDLDESLGLFERLFDMKPTKIAHMPEAGLKIAHLRARNVGIELLQYTSDEEGIGRVAMGPGKGINHISIPVEDMTFALQDFQEKGIKVVEGFPRPGSHGQVAFFIPETTQGILLEICERPKES